MRTRAIVLAALFVLVGFGAVVYNLYQLQIVQHDELAARAENQQLADETITPNRGVIYDSDMKVLARSNKVWTVVASPRDMANSGTNINDVAVKLAELLELDAQSILEKLQKSESNYQLIKRQIEKAGGGRHHGLDHQYNASDKGKDTPCRGHQPGAGREALLSLPDAGLHDHRLCERGRRRRAGHRELLQRYAQGHRRARGGHEERLGVRFAKRHLRGGL